MITYIKTTIQERDALKCPFLQENGDLCGENIRDQVLHYSFFFIFIFISFFYLIYFFKTLFFIFILFILFILFFFLILSHQIVSHLLINDKKSLTLYIKNKEETILRANPNCRWCPREGCGVGNIGEGRKGEIIEVITCRECGYEVFFFFFFFFYFVFK